MIKWLTRALLVLGIVAMIAWYELEQTRQQLRQNMAITSINF